MSSSEEAEFHIDVVLLDSLITNSVEDVENVIDAFQTKQNGRPKRKVNYIKVEDISLVKA